MNELTKMKWKDLTIKDRISYTVAIALMGTGVLMAFLSFFLNAYDIATGVLIYVAQTFVLGGAMIGANVYFKSKWVEFDTRLHDEIEKRLSNVRSED